MGFFWVYAFLQSKGAHAKKSWDTGKKVHALVSWARPNTPRESCFFRGRRCTKKDKSKKQQRIVSRRHLHGIFRVSIIPRNNHNSNAAAFPVHPFLFFPLFCLAIVHKDRRDIRAHRHTTRPLVLPANSAKIYDTLSQGNTNINKDSF